MGEQVAAGSFVSHMEALASILEEKVSSLHKWLLNGQKDMYLENRIQSQT